MHLLLGCIAFGSFGIIAVIAEGNPSSQKTLKRNKRLSRRRG